MPRAPEAVQGRGESGDTMKLPIDKRKPETIMAEQRSIIKMLRIEAAGLGGTCSDFRARATRAEQEAAEWKKRFDALLARVPLAALPVERAK